MSDGDPFEDLSATLGGEDEGEGEDESEGEDDHEEAETSGETAPATSPESDDVDADGGDGDDNGDEEDTRDTAAGDLGDPGGDATAETETGAEAVDEAEAVAESAGGDDATQSGDPLTDQAFSYEAAHQRPVYARPATIDDFDAWVSYELELELDRRGYRNIVVREMTDALLRTVVEEDLVEEVAERFERARDSAAGDD